MYTPDGVDESRLLLHGTGQGLELLDDCLRMDGGDLFGKLLPRFYGLWIVHDKIKFQQPLFIISWNYMPDSLSNISVLFQAIFISIPGAQKRH